MSSSNSLASSLHRAARFAQVDVESFSKMKSKPQARDIAPEAIALWRGYIDLDGCERLLPPHDAAGSALGPADAKTGVQQGPNDWQKQGRYSPAKGRTRVVFGE